MSKKHNNQNRNFPWLLAALGGLMLLTAIYMFSSPERGTPVVSVDQELIDYGEVKLDTPLTFSVVVTNTGDGVLRFRDKPYLEVREGC
jgi:hypothetical protein